MDMKETIAATKTVTTKLFSSRELVKILLSVAVTKTVFVLLFDSFSNFFSCPVSYSVDLTHLFCVVNIFNH